MAHKEISTSRRKSQTHQALNFALSEGSTIFKFVSSKRKSRISLDVTADFGEDSKEIDAHGSDCSEETTFIDWEAADQELKEKIEQLEAKDKELAAKDDELFAKDS